MCCCQWETIHQSFGIFKSQGKRCLTWPKYITENKFKFSVTQKNDNITNNSRENITCHTQNVIFYFIAISAIRVNSGCEYVIKHLKDVCIGASFSVQIIEAFPGTGYKNNRVCPVDRETRLDRED